MLGIAIFAALAYTMTKGLRGGQSATLTARQADIAAAEIIDYARQVEQAVNKVRLNGCSENDISFENCTTSDYIHSPQVDEKCHIFNSTGGRAVLFQTHQSDVFDNILTPIFQGCIRVQDVGSNTLANGEGHELLMWTRYVDRSVCLAMNEQLGIDNPSGEPPRDTTDRPFDGVAYTGSFGCAANVIDAPEVVGQHAGCFVSNLNANTPFNNDDYYYGYFVLLER